ncbi:hypothetical protein T09_8456 [Trichinella sp. T9]|nr:hypothetical protein T09_8456 [Trichinella sp. T9]
MHKHKTAHFVPALLCGSHTMPTQSLNCRPTVSYRILNSVFIFITFLFESSNSEMQCNRCDVIWSTRRQSRGPNPHGPEDKDQGPNQPQHPTMLSRRAAGRRLSTRQYRIKFHRPTPCAIPCDEGLPINIGEAVGPMWKSVVASRGRIEQY